MGPTPLVWAAAAWAQTCEGPIADLVATLRETRAKQAYMCLVERDDAGPALLAEIQAADAETEGQTAVTRALAVHLMPRLGRRISPEEARALNAADRRLLRDAVYARRGRRSPSAENDEVFQQFDWYEPDPGFSNARLDQVDRDNIAILDRPPPGPEPEGLEPALAAMEEAAAAEKGSRCGCSAAGAAPGWLLGLAALTLARRRCPKVSKEVSENRTV